MRIGFDDLQKRLPDQAEVPSGLKWAAIREHVDDAGVRERVESVAVRERIDEFYAYAFLPPTVTDEDFGSDTAPTADVVYDGFEFGAWLGSGRNAETETLLGDSQATEDETTESRTTDAEADDEFHFDDWLASGSDDFEPVDLSSEDTETTSAAQTASTAEQPTLSLSTDIHPMRAATFALFFAVVALAVLSVIGYLPALGPASGL